MPESTRGFPPEPALAEAGAGMTNWQAAVFNDFIDPPGGISGTGEPTAKRKGVSL